jgi:small conductance mechanosensitive channel
MDFRRYPRIVLLIMMGLLLFPPASIRSQETGDINDVLPKELLPKELLPQNGTQEISVGADKIEDGLIEKRLADVYRSIPELATVQTDVNAGVVRLSGQVPSKEAHQKALSLAGRVEGVVSVTDAITHEREIRERLTIVQEKLEKQINNLVSYLPLLVIALTVFLIFWFLASFIAKWDSLYRQFTSHVFLQSLLKQIVRGTILFIGFIIVLEILDATALLGTIVGVAGIMGLALGFALRDTVENYIASILLSIRQPFRPFDQIVLENYEGLVMKLTSRETILMTLDGNHVRIPNAMVYKGIILNYSRNPKRRFSFEVGISTDVNIEAARQLALETLNHTSGVIPDPPALCAIEKLGESNVILKIFAWTTQDQFDYLKVRSEAIRAVKEAYDLANYDMPEPIYRLKVQEYAPLEDPAALEQLHAHKEASAPQTVQASHGADVSRDSHIGEQIMNDKKGSQEMDLLQSEDKQLKS